VALGVDEPALESRVRARRVLSLERLKPGRYLIEVRVRAPDGASTARRREFLVIR
jgi:hypothetical protein